MNNIFVWIAAFVLACLLASAAPFSFNIEYEYWIKVLLIMAFIVVGPKLFAKYKR